MTPEDQMHTMTESEIREWIAQPWLWERVTTADILGDRRASMGTDDVPHMSLTERTYTDDQRRVYGEWGAGRNLRWDIDPRNPVLDINMVASRMSAFIVAFVRRNGRIQVTVQAPWHGRRETLVIDAIAGDNPVQ